MRCSVLSHIVKIDMIYTHALFPRPTTAHWANAATCNLCHMLLRHVRTCQHWLQTRPTQWTNTTIPIRILFEQTSYNMAHELCVLDNQGYGHSFRIYNRYCFPREGRDSSVGMATRYGLDGPGVESRLGRDFSHLCRTALGPTQRPIQWVSGPFAMGKAAGAWCLPTNLM